ncbi:MAG: nucleotidyltransferase family protein [Comamonadaceae bacterium]|nr:MAG: nucleotidyltransferase family protein [Comamonadaceae bacterium]
MDEADSPAGLPVVIVLAAGRGERFRASGGTSHKLDALLGGKRVLDHVLDAVRASGLQHHLVCADASRPGMGDSIAAGVRATAGAAGWLILPGDLPLVRPATLQAVARALAAYEVVVPVHCGERGHPVGFASGCGSSLRQLAGEQGAARIVKSRAAFLLEVDDAGTVTDIDTTGDLARAAGAFRLS